MKCRKRTRNTAAHLDSCECEEKVPVCPVLCHILVVASQADRCDSQGVKLTHSTHALLLDQFMRD